MRESIHLGKLAGIRIGAHWSLLLIFGLIAWELAAIELPAVAGGYANGVYVAAGVLVALLFYGSLLAHEMAHALVARRAGIAVDGIVLWLLGGVSQLHGEASRARVEFRIAIAGPATSLGLAMAFLGFSGTLQLAGAPRLLVGALFWLGLINGILAAFNLVPAFPLDGGRVLRAVVWARTGDKLRATSTAARVGKAFGYVLVGLGVVELVAGGVLGGVWFMLLGWFLLGASQAEAYSSRLTTELAGVAVGDVMARCTEPHWIELGQLAEDDFVARPGQMVVDVLQQMVTQRSTRAVVVEPLVGTGPAAVGLLVGTLTSGDVARAAEHRELLQRAGVAGPDHRAAA